MFEWFVKKTNNKKGFTLIELVVVIAILGILSAIAVPKFGESRKNAADVAHKANKRTLESAAIMCIAKEGAPTADAGVTWTGAKSGDGATHMWEDYLQDWPPAPTGTGDTSVDGKAYTVTISTTGEIKVVNE